MILLVLRRSSGESTLIIVLIFLKTIRVYRQQRKVISPPVVLRTNNYYAEIVTWCYLNHTSTIIQSFKPYLILINNRPTTLFFRWFQTSADCSQERYEPLQWCFQKEVAEWIRSGQAGQLREARSSNRGLFDTSEAIFFYLITIWLPSDYHLITIWLPNFIFLFLWPSGSVSLQQRFVKFEKKP